ncbi:hypothetical protein [Corynebacterium urealyticum]|uniref:hypothetical protein n=1 Tax=Corynebacterium urealyticum TaxID=43771 RepID=UPI00293E518B|nr:hypothetical protein [Corynebacterium urealyticum]WOH93888.1 hypothetical protein RZ943_07285 [Corynebacterium urealyticum]
MATTAGWRLWLRERNEEIIGELAELSEWVVQQTDLAINAQAVLLPQVFNEAEKRTRRSWRTGRRVWPNNPPWRKPCAGKPHRSSSPSGRASSSSS